MTRIATPSRILKSFYQARLPDGERNEQDVEPTTEELRGAYEHIDDADWNW